MGTPPPDLLDHFKKYDSYILQSNIGMQLIWSLTFKLRSS
jgi:hypothetical protein